MRNLRREDRDYFPEIYAVVICMACFAAVFMIGFVAKSERDTQRAIAEKPYQQGVSVRIVANGKHGVVLSKRLNYVTVSYVDDVGRMNNAELLYSQVEPWKEKE